MPDRDRQLDQAERDFTTAVGDALTETADEFADAVLAATELVAARFSVGRIARMWGGRVSGLVRRLLGTAEEAATAAAEDIGADLPDGWDDLPGRYDDGTLPERIGQYVETTEHLLRAVGNRLAEETRAELAAGIDAREDIDQLRTRLRAAFAREGTHLGPVRERRIAQTEASRAWNTSTLAAAQAASGPDRPVVKQWITRHDKKVRTAHDRADGQIRLLSEPFTVGGVAMQTPGDPSAPAGLVINCRCRLEVAPELRATTAGSQVSLLAPSSNARKRGVGHVMAPHTVRTVIPSNLASATFHGTQGRPSYRKYHPKGGSKRALSRHANGGMLGSDRFTENEHSQVLHSYTLAGYDDMNRWLRFRGEPDDVTVDEVQRHVSALYDLISVQEPTTSTSTLYRGMRGHVIELNEGDEFHDKGFVSSSSDEKVAHMMVGKKGGTFYRITVPAGARMLDVASVGEADDEREVILPPGTKYRVKSVGRLDDPTRPAVLYELEVINA